MSAGALTITAQQCKRARGLLKWNAQDLASHTRISVRQIEKFERNQARLLRPENEEIVKTFKEHGITFNANGEVNSLNKAHQETHNTSAQETVIYDLSNPLTDSLSTPAAKPPEPDPAPLIAKKRTTP